MVAVILKMDNLQFMACSCQKDSVVLTKLEGKIPSIECISKERFIEMLNTYSITLVNEKGIRRLNDAIYDFYESDKGIKCKKFLGEQAYEEFEILTRYGNFKMF